MGIEIGVWDDDGGTGGNKGNIGYSLRKWLFANGATVTWMYGHASVLNEDGSVTINGKVCVPPEKIVRIAPAELNFEESGMYDFESEVRAWRDRKAAEYQRLVEVFSKEF